MDKLKIGIDIDEVLRAKWIQFDTCYVKEFGEVNLPDIDKLYTNDFRNVYNWTDNDVVEKTLKDEITDDINVMDYIVDSETGIAPIDTYGFNETVKHVTADEQYHNFMFVDYVFEINALAPLFYRNMDLDVNNFIYKYQSNIETIAVSQENHFTIPSTLYFLSKSQLRFKNIAFFENDEDVWNGIDVLITANPNYLKNVPDGKQVIKISRPYNTDITDGFLMEVLQINDLNENEIFETLINYVKPNNE